MLSRGNTKPFLLSAQGIHTGKWEKLFKGLRNNSHVSSVSLANCNVTDTVGAMIADCLRCNKSIRLLTLDSNNITGDVIVALIKATSKSLSLEELKVSNQVTWAPVTPRRDGG